METSGQREEGPEGVSTDLYARSKGDPSSLPEAGRVKRARGAGVAYCGTVASSLIDSALSVAATSRLASSSAHRPAASR